MSLTKAEAEEAAANLRSKLINEYVDLENKYGQTEATDKFRSTYPDVISMFTQIKEEIK